METNTECVVGGADIQGEVPLWCALTRRLSWIDVRRIGLQSYDPSARRHEPRRSPEGMLVGSIALREAGGLLLATNTSLYRYDPAQPRPPEFLANPEADKPDNRLNDGKCDRRGRFWVGSRRDAQRLPEGTLYRFDPDHSCHPQFGGIVVSTSEEH